MKKDQTGKTLPQHQEVEKQFLGLMLDTPNAARKYCKLMQHEYFFNPHHQELFKKIKASQLSGRYYDRLQAIQDGFIDIASNFSITDIFEETPKEWYEIIRQSFSARLMIDYATEAVIDAYDGKAPSDVFKSLLEGNTEVRKLLYGDIVKTKMEIIQELQEHMDSAMNAKGGITGMPLSGIHSFDKELNGYQKGESVVIAGRPGMGKTVFAMQHFKRAIELNLPTRFYSLEMTSMELLLRYIAQTSSNKYEDLRRGKIHDRKGYDMSLEMFMDSNAEIIDRGGMNWFDIENDALSANESIDLKVVIVDYAQLTGRIKGMNDTEKMNEVARGSKTLAKNIEGAVFLLSQLNREVESRSNKIPQLSDLKQSGAIEENADKAIFPYRPEYYNLDPMNVYGDMYDGLNADSLFVLKNRAGTTFRHSVSFAPERMEFEEKSPYGQIANQQNDMQPNNDYQQQNPF